MSTTETDPDKVYSGSEANAAAKFFDWDMEFESYCEAVFGDLGVDHWRGTAPKVNAANLSDEVDKLYRWISIAEGSKAAHASWNDTDFWTAQYQNDYRLHKMRKMFQHMRSMASGRFYTWLQEFKAKEFKTIRDLAMSEFGLVNQIVISSWEATFRAGCPQSKSAVAFPDGVDMKAKVLQLKKMQRLLVHLCGGNETHCITGTAFSNRSGHSHSWLHSSIVRQFEIRGIANGNIQKE